MQDASPPLSDPARLAALRRAALLGTPAEESFDRLTRFAARLLHAPMALISLVDEERQFFKSQCGLPEPWARERQTPLSHSFCQHVVASAAPLVIENARQFALVRDNLAIRDLGVEAYLGIPIRSPDGHVLGSFCVIDHEPRSWTEEEVEVLQELASSVMTEIELRVQVQERRAAEEVRAELEAVIESMPDAVYIGTREGVTRTNAAGLRILGFHSPGELQGNIAALAERTHPRDAISGEPIRPEEGPFAHALGGEQIVREMIVRHVSTGEDRIVRAAAAPIRVGEEVRGAVAVITDVTEQKRAEEAVRESERRFRLMVEGSEGVFFYTHDPEGRFTYLSPSVSEMLGYEPDELVGRHYDVLLTGDASNEEVYERTEHGLRTEGGSSVYTALTRHHSGRTVPIEVVETSVHRDGVVVGMQGIARDTTMRRQAEERERELIRQHAAREHAEEARERIRGILESITDAFFAVDENWCFTYVNREAEALLDASREELLGRNLWELYPASAERAFYSHYHRAVAEQVTVEFEEYSPRPDRWLQVRAYPYEEGLTVYLRDITRRKRAEATADMEQRRLRAMLDALPVAVFIADVSGRVTRTNSASERIWETDDLPLPESPDEYHNYPAWWPDGGGRLEPGDWGLARALAGESVDEQEIEIEAFDGTRKTILNYARPILGADGEPLGAVATVVDITERKEAEEALRRSEERFRNIVENMGEAVIITDLEERVLYANPRVEKLFGHSPDELRGKIASEVLMPPEQRAAQKERQERRAEGISERYEVHHWRKDGTRIWVEIDGVPFRSADGEITGTLGVVRDITGRKQVEEALRAAKEEAEAASRAKSELLSRTSHELRTPMNAILGFAQLLELDLEKPENRESIEQILRAGRHLLSLIDEVLDIAHADSGQMALPTKPVDVREIVAEVLPLVRQPARQNGIELPSSSPDGCDRQVLAEPRRLKQVLLNLLSNAIKYNRAGGRVELSCTDAPGERVRIEVRDTGPGIGPERLSRLFVPFERAGAEQTKIEGMGLGLALAKALVEAMGGSVGADSVPGEGSTFWIELPRAGLRADAAGAGGPGDAAGTEPGSAPIVLYVEDEPANMRIVERILRRSRPDVELITAARGREGLKLARERSPDLILLDLNLPDISGEKVLRTLREGEATREIPVVMISGVALPEQIQRLRELGAADYVTKPFDVPHFLRVMTEALGTAGT